MEIVLKVPNVGTILLQESNGLLKNITFRFECPLQTYSQKHASPLLNNISRQIKGYLEGILTSFELPQLDWSVVTPFQKNVYKRLAQVPYGNLTTYGSLAKAVGCASARAIGQALNSNPFPIIIPCHRVIGSGGKLVGFGGGLHWKRFLLALEGRKVEGDRVHFSPGELELE